VEPFVSRPAYLLIKPASPQITHMESTLNELKRKKHRQS
jgi:hypothetical protein